MAKGLATKNRIFFVDFLRAAVITLVMVHHLAIIYSGNPFFYYFEPTSDAIAALALVIFQLLNHGWFLGMFFLISGYFSAGSIDRKGPVKFMKARLVRLGIPLLAFAFLLGPLSFYIGMAHLTPIAITEAQVSIPMLLNWQTYSQTIGPGVLWFVAMLLIFDFGYAILRGVDYNRKRKQAKQQFPTNGKILLYMLVFAIVTYLTRLILPIGKTVFFFPSLYDLPLYTSFFAIGIVAARGNWFRELPTHTAKYFFLAAVFATLTLFPLAIINMQGGSWPFGIGSYKGYGSLASFVYAVWESIFAVGFSMGIIVFFRHFLDVPGKVWEYASKYSYAAYVMHIPVIIIFTAILLSGISLPPLPKFALASLISLPMVWLVAYFVRKLPLADRVL